MTAEQIKDMVALITGIISAIGGAAWGLITWLNNRHKEKLKKIEEESYGKIAVTALEKELAAVKNDLRELRSQVEKDTDAIERLEDHYSVLIERIFDIYKMKSLKA